MKTQAIQSDYADFVNPAWSLAMQEAGLTARPVSALGSWFEMDDNTRMLDFVSGYGAAPLGHNHPELLKRLANDLQDPAPNLHPLGTSLYAGRLAAQLIKLAGMPDGKVFFSSTGAETVDSAIKFSFMHTGRSRIISIVHGFHGLSIAATWLSGSDFWRQGLPSAPKDFTQIPLGDISAIAAVLSKNDIAAVILEPIQGTAGACAWDHNDLTQLAALCRTHGTLLIFDEVLCGLGRSGHWFAFQALDIDPPDITLVSKGLTGGVIPVSAVLMSQAIYQSVFMRTGTAKIHGSTFGGNRLAMCCGLHTLALLQDLDVLQNVTARSKQLQQGINRLGLNAGFICEGIGLVLSIRFNRSMGHYYGEQIGSLLAYLLLQQNVMTIPAAHDADSLRLLPPLTVRASEINHFLSAFECALLALADYEEPS